MSNLGYVYTILSAGEPTLGHHHHYVPVEDGSFPTERCVCGSTRKALPIPAGVGKPLPPSNNSKKKKAVPGTIYGPTALREVSRIFHKTFRQPPISNISANHPYERLSSFFRNEEVEIFKKIANDYASRINKVIIYPTISEFYHRFKLLAREYTAGDSDYSELQVLSLDSSPNIKDFPALILIMRGIWMQIINGAIFIMLVDRLLVLLHKYTNGAVELADTIQVRLAMVELLTYHLRENTASKLNYRVKNNTKKRGSTEILPTAMAKLPLNEMKSLMCDEKLADIEADYEEDLPFLIEDLTDEDIKSIIEDCFF